MNFSYNGHDVPIFLFIEHSLYFPVTRKIPSFSKKYSIFFIFWINDLVIKKARVNTRFF